jgi:hypothetical protein
MPPALSGVADHATELLPALRAHGSVEMAPASHTGVNLYHLGNNQLHAEIYNRALREPGITILHDAVLHHFILGSHSRDDYLTEFVYNYGEWTRELASDLWMNRPRSAADARYFAYPMLRRVVEKSRALVVHNPGAAALVREHVPTARVFEIPLLYVPRSVPHAADVLGARAGLGVRPAELLCGVFGHIRESKRLHVAARACDAAGLRLLVAGRVPPEMRDACVTVRGNSAPLPEPEFTTLTHAVDVCINLRYPPAGETSAIGVQLMAAAKAVLFTNGPEITRYPESACVRIDAGLRERAHVEEALTLLKTVPSLVRDIGARARAHILHHHSASRVAALYWEAIRSVS